MLESIGKDAWPSLQEFASSKRSECELFVGLVAECDGVTVKERVATMKQLAENPYAGVRSAVVDELSEFEEDVQQSVLEVLAKNTDVDIR